MNNPNSLPELTHLINKVEKNIPGTCEVLRERDGSGGGERERAEVERRSFEYERLRERLRGDRERERVYERRPPPL